MRLVLSVRVMLLTVILSMLRVISPAIEASTSRLSKLMNWIWLDEKRQSLKL